MLYSLLSMFVLYISSVKSMWKALEKNLKGYSLIFFIRKTLLYKKASSILLLFFVLVMLMLFFMMPFFQLLFLLNFFWRIFLFVLYKVFYFKPESWTFSDNAVNSEIISVLFQYSFDNWKSQTRSDNFTLMIFWTIVLIKNKLYLIRWNTLKQVWPVLL